MVGEVIGVVARNRELSPDLRAETGRRVRHDADESRRKGSAGWSRWRVSRRGCGVGCVATAAR